MSSPRSLEMVSAACQKGGSAARSIRPSTDRSARAGETKTALPSLASTRSASCRVPMHDSAPGLLTQDSEAVRGGSPSGTGGSVSSSSAVGKAGGGGSGPVETLHFDGRFDEEDPAAPAFTWSGTSIGTRLSGPSVSVVLDGSAGVFFQILVDGTP